MDELEGRSLVQQFEDQWARIDAYERRPDLALTPIPARAQRLIDVAMAIYDEVWVPEGPDETRLQALYEDLGVAGAAYREAEEQR